MQEIGVPAELQPVVEKIRRKFLTNDTAVQQ